MNNLSTRDLKIDIPATCGGTMLLTGIYPRYRYDGSVRTDDIVGFAYDVLLAERSYTAMRVNIAGECPFPNGSLVGTPRVAFDCLTLGVYAIKGRSGVYAKATGIHVID